MPTPKLTAEILIAAIEGFEQQKIRIDAQIAELRIMLSGSHTEPISAPEIPKGKRRKLSAAARKRIGDAQRKRWAETRSGPETPSKVAPQPSKPKRRLSAAGKAAIVAALKKRWAAKRAAAKNATPAMAKKAAAKKNAAKKSQKKAAKAPEAAAVTAQPAA